MSKDANKGLSEMKLKVKLQRVAATLALILMYSGVSAETVYYPKDKCTEILSVEVSTGNGDSAVNQVDVLCKDASGNYTAYVGSWTNVAGLFGLGRMSTPEVMTFVPYDGNTVTVE